jgi:hypothetical protein
MSSSSMPLKIAAVALVVVLLVSIAIVLSRKASQSPVVGGANAALQPVDALSCTGVSSPTSTGQAQLEANPHPHSVSLSWNPTVPASSSPRDAVQGYYVYRSLTSHTYSEGDRISRTPLPTTHCVDTTVEPQRTYFYVVKALTTGGTQSGSSAEIKAVVPSP